MEAIIFFYIFVGGLTLVLSSILWVGENVASFNPRRGVIGAAFKITGITIAVLGLLLAVFGMFGWILYFIIPSLPMVLEAMLGEWFVLIHTVVGVVFGILMASAGAKIADG